MPSPRSMATKMSRAIAAFAGILIVLGTIAGPLGAQGAGPLAPTSLRCEYLENPLGIDMAKPRFFWVLGHTERGQVQTAYQILVSTVAQASAGDIWDSGKVASAKSVQIAFAGKALESRKTYYWKVKSWDREGRESPWSAVARFDTGLFNRTDWKGAWIGGKNQLRKEFALNGRIRRARAHIAGLGYYELRLNGRKAGNHVLDPAWTTYDKRVLYVTYDVTSFLREGANAVAVMLGQGWYKSRALLLQLDVELEDGTTVERRQRHVLAGRRRPDLRRQRLRRRILRRPPRDPGLGPARLRRQGMARGRGRQGPGRRAFGPADAGDPGRRYDRPAQDVESQARRLRLRHGPELQRLGPAPRRRPARHGRPPALRRAPL